MLLKGFEDFTSRMFTCLKKNVVIPSILLGSWTSANALVIIAENEYVCPNEGVVLYSEDASASFVTWQKEVDGEWVNASEFGSQLEVGVPFVYEMDDHDVTFRAVEMLGTNITAISNELTIKKGTDCVPECHSSSTGDFIFGTDFDPISGANTGKLENDVVNFFGEYTLEFSKQSVLYTIGGLQSSFGDYVPSIDKKVMEGTEGGYDNYFMNLKNPNGTVVKISFPANPSQCDNGFNYHNVSYRRQNYRFVMRAYIKPACNIGNAAFRARTGHGTVTDDRMDVELYDDETGALLGSLSDLKSQNDVAEVKFSSLTNVGNLPMSGGQYHMLRFEITFYGYMPYVNEGLSHYTFTPEFTQLSCADIAIDYISAEVEKVCLSPKMVCKGEMVHATATGFPKNASYKWYRKKNNGDWEELFGASGKGDNYRTAHIPVDFVGAKEYKVIVDKGDGSEKVTKDFTVYGKECAADSVSTSNPCDILNEENVDKLVNVYTVEGYVLKENVKLSEALKNLKRGFYIVGDKKIYVSE